MQTVKCYPLTDNLHWRYRIHEEITCDRTNTLLLRNGYYNHYQDLSKGRNYYDKLKDAYKVDPTCIHYLTYLIWEAQLHRDWESLKKYCLEDMYQILNNKEDQHYKDWAYYIYACLVYIDSFEVDIAELKEILINLNNQDETFKAYYLFKAKLCEILDNKYDLVVNLIKALYAERTNNWVEANFNDTEAEICTKLSITYYYKFMDYEKAYLWSERALQYEDNELTRNNVEICKRVFKEVLYEK
jgi:hypothetical protein